MVDKTQFLGLIVLRLVKPERSCSQFANSEQGLYICNMAVQNKLQKQEDKLFTKLFEYYKTVDEKNALSFLDAYN